MIAYLIRRLLYAVPTVLGILFLTFAMFFIANSPRDMARRALGMKADDVAITKWIQRRGYDLPLLYNGNAQGAGRFTQTLLYQKCACVLVFDMGRSDANDRDIAGEIRRRMMPSLAIGVPSFVLGLLVEITLSLIVAFLRGTYLDRGATVLCVLMLSISGLFYIIGGQFVFAQWLKLFPISGFDWGGSTFKFVFLPVLIGVVGGIGGSVRFGRTVMVEETGKDYVRTARAKGLGESAVMFRHVLKNASIPILTGAVMSIPFLFMGSMLMESFFGIPGLGSMTINAINAQDFAVIRSMTFIGAVLYIIGLLMTDVSYTLVDPRITLGAGGSQDLQGQPSLKDAGAILGTLVVLGAAGYGTYKGYMYLSGVDFITNIGKRLPFATNAGAAGVVLGLAGFLLHARRSELWVSAWRQVRRDKTAMASLAVIMVFLVVGMMDSVAWSDVERPAGGGPNAQAAMTPPLSILDRVCRQFRLTTRPEKTYSAPLADTLVAKATVDKLVDGKQVFVDGRPLKERVYKPLDHPGTHLLGTDQTGNDVLYITLKGVRTALIIGGLTTILAVPFAMLFGVVAGFFGGWVDDVITYIYTTLSCIPSVLLIACFMLVFGKGIVQLCIVMGITGWVGLCRLLRGETLKLRDREYVQAATALGVSKYRILARHIVPNVMHLVLITVVLSFSGRVLSEAMLSYIGIGVGPDTYSWGTMINGARNELGREPMVWWNLAASFAAMLALVLPANLFADSLRDALDPSLRIRGKGE
jgi:peptide/nickel transport system permease protein